MIIIEQMKVFEDFETQTEVLSDSYPIVEIFEGCGYEVQSTEITIGGEKINVGCGNAFGGQEEEEAEESEKANNILNAFGYEETTFTKALYGTYIKDYMKRVLDYLTKSKPNRVEAFKKGAKEMATWIIKNYDDFTFYCNKNCEGDSNIILSYFKEGQTQPTFVYWADALKAVKV